MLAPGTNLGPYTITGLLGVGGMGEVYRAHDSRLEREVAIKVLPDEVADDAKALERFRRETRAVAALSHPNILAIFDVGYEDGVHYAVTELLEGETLRGRFASQGRFTPREALEVMLQIADGVAAAHARGIVHRDLKPENIFVTTTGLVKVLDFGLARGGTGPIGASVHSPTEILPTEPGMVLGTMGYAAPEQIEARGVTPPTDVFALGCVLYEMITTRLPFERGSAISQMVALLHEPAPRLSEGGGTLLREVDAIVQRCLAKTPAQRMQNGGELANEIRSALAGHRTTSRLPTPRPQRVLWIVAALALIGLIAAVFALHRLRNRQIDHGYDLRVSDIRGDTETRRLIELALRADAEGNRSKAIELFEEAWRRPARTALPAAFLSSFADAAGHNPLGREWGTKALARLDSSTPVYESLLARYLLVPSMHRSQELALAKSALDVRPDAWRLRLAAAHILLGQRDREAARRELQRIDVSKPDDRRLMLVLADRASLGDANGAERDLRSSRIANRPPFRNYVDARIAWSRGDFNRATQLFDRAAKASADEALGNVEVEASLLSGIALLRLGRFDEAQRRFASTAARARQLGLSTRIFDASAFAAYTAWRTGDHDLRDRRLAEAASVNPPPAPWAALRLLAIRTGSDAWKLWSTTAIENETILAPVMSLIRAREAFTTADLETAKRELRRARAEGIDTSEMREEAELLSSELGLPFEVLVADPPYPNVLRYMAIFDLTKWVSS